MECEQEEKNTSEENHVQLSEKFCEETDDNSCLDSNLLKKNHSGFIDELDFEDESSNGCDNMANSEFHLHDLVPEETDSVKDEKIVLQEEVECGELSETEAPKNAASSDSKGEISENSSDANDDIEEGEVKDDSFSYDMKNTVCRYFLRGKCDWGNNCRFFHVTDKGLYNMFDNVQTRKTFIPPPINIAPKEFSEPNFPQPREYVEVASTGWDRALHEAKQAILRSKARREEDDEFEDKKLYNNFRDDISHFKKYSPPKKQFPSSNVNNLISSKLRYKNNENSLSFNVLKNKSESPPNRLSRKREVKYVKKADYPEKWQDPWRRSKSPDKKRRWHSSSSSSSKKSRRSERSSVSVTSCASDSSCSCSDKSLSPESRTIYHKRVHNRNGSVSRNSRYRSVSRSVSRSRSRKTSWSSISSSSLSSVSSSTTIRSESFKDRDELRSRHHKKHEIKNKSRYSPFRSESRYSRSSSPTRYHSPAIKSPLRKRRRRNSSDMSLSPDSRSSNHNRRHVEWQKTVSMNEKSSLTRINKRDPFSDNGLVSRMDHSDKIASRGFASDVQLKRTVGPSKVQERKPIPEEKYHIEMPYSNVKREKSNVVLEEKKMKDKDMSLPKRGADVSGSHNLNIPYSNIKREKSNVVLEEKKPRDKDLNLPKKGVDLSGSHNLLNKQDLSCKNSASEVKQKSAKDNKVNVPPAGNDLLKYHFLTKSMRVSNNSTTAKVEKPPTNPPNKPSVTSDTVPKQESVKPQATVNEPKRKITLNLHSKNDRQIKLSEDSLKVKSSKKSNLPPQTSRREQLLKQLKAVEEAIARKKTTV